MALKSSVMTEGLPDKIEELIGFGLSRRGVYSKEGCLFATGNKDGSIILWHMETRGPVKVLVNRRAKTAITSLSWSKCSRKLIFANGSQDLTLWDLETSKQHSVTTFGSKLVTVMLNPGNSREALACPIASPAYLVDVTTGEKAALPATKNSSQAKLMTGMGKNPGLIHQPMAATFSSDGKYVFLGTACGDILVVDSKTRQLVNHLSVENSPCILHLAVSNDGKKLLCVSNDKAIRLYRITVNENRGRKSSKPVCLDLKLRFREESEKLCWKAPCFSALGDYVAAGAVVVGGGHWVYVWDAHTGQVVRILEGPREKILDLCWHPKENSLVSVSEAGFAFFWTKAYRERWTDFAPDFVEVTENVVYVEREDEFDLEAHDGEEASRAVEGAQSEDEEVDVLTVDEAEGSSESEEERKFACWLWKQDIKEENEVLAKYAEADPDFLPQEAPELECDESPRTASGEELFQARAPSGNSSDKVNDKQAEGEVFAEDTPPKNKKRSFEDSEEIEEVKDDGAILECSKRARTDGDKEERLNTP